MSVHVILAAVVFWRAQSNSRDISLAMFQKIGSVWAICE